MVKKNIIYVILIVMFVIIVVLWDPGARNETRECLAAENSLSPMPVVSSDEVGLDHPATTPPVPTVQSKYQKMHAKNSDAVGWLTIDNTRIDYPVVQSTDNDCYIDKDFNGDESVNGAIYLDYHCDLGDMKDPRNLVIYGHHMSDGSMFADLMKYKDEDFFNENRFITFNTLYQDYQWEVFAAYVTPLSFNYINTTFLTKESWIKFLNICKSKSKYQNDVIPQADDVILTLSTCTYEFNGARFVVQAILYK